MLNTVNRVKKNKEFSYIYKKGKFYSCKYFLVHFVDTKLNVSKVGISVTKKIGNSVIRSKVKRVMSEVVRLLLPSLQVKNYIITLKPEVVEADFNTLNYEFNKFITKYSLIKDTKDV